MMLSCEVCGSGDCDVLTKCCICGRHVCRLCDGSIFCKVMRNSLKAITESDKIAFYKQESACSRCASGFAELCRKFFEVD